ncbi:MAG: flagellar biosynthesis protein FlhF [Candidatus Sericytochromatia bacterium]|nr:flagellar biosynthesis protein FlhF [Candidatus Tanganyikabacteria bacterium]
MKIRQYTAPTVQEALIKIKLDLGPDAVILHQRKLRKGGFLGFFGKEVVEVLAAVDTTPPPRKKREIEPEPEEFGPPPAPRRTPTAPLAPAGGIGPWDAPAPDERPAIATGNPLKAIAEAALAQSGSLPAAAPAIAAQVAEQVKTAVLGELSDQVRDVVSRAVGTAVGEVADKLGDKVEAAVSRLESAAPAKGSWTPAQQKVYDQLVKADLDPALARQALVKLHAAGAAGETQMTERLPDVIAGFVKVAGPIAPGEAGTRPAIVILVGPTGVGKTTTIAKLAATFRLGGRAVGLITIDTYRIAAVEQLKTYGDIIGIPVEVVQTPGALRDATARLADREVILVDTAGRSPSHKLHLNELRSFLEALPRREVHLVLSATATRANLLRAIESFSQVGVDRLLITKTDEAATLGSVVSAVQASGKPLSYMTHGQSVPDDLREADAKALAAAMLGGQP